VRIHGGQPVHEGQLDDALPVGPEHPVSEDDEAGGSLSLDGGKGAIDAAGSATS
jgi:hypothetical protein